MSTEFLSKDNQIKLAQVLQTSASKLRKMAELEKRASEAEAKLAAVNLHLECEKLAHDMHDKGLEVEHDFGDLVSSLKKEASEGRLETIKAAVKMAASGQSVGRINNQDEAHGGASDFERWIMD